MNNPVPANEHVKLHFQPNIYLTSEHVAEVLNISVEKADQLLSGPDTYTIVRHALADGLNTALDAIVHQMARSRWPSVMDRNPIRRDVNVEVTGLSIVGRTE